MKKCAFCKAEKPLAEFTKDISNKSGYSCQCRVCRAISRKTNGAARKKAQQEKIDELIACQTGIEPEKLNIALPMTFVPRGIYRPDNRGYVRNEGLKHIQSKGYSC